MTLKSITLSDPARYPVLRPGVNFFKVAGQNCSDIYVGFSNRGIELKFEIANELLQLLDGSESLQNIMRIMSSKQDESLNNLEFDAILNILQLLNSASLIEFRTSPIPRQLLKNKRIKDKITKPDLLPVNLVNSFNRMRAEENLYSWHPEVSAEKNAEILIGRRRNFSIMIYGRNRLALSLFAVLQASGFNLIKLTDRTSSTTLDSSLQIEPDEVCGLAIRGSDVGLAKASVLADLARNSRLFTADNLEFPARPDFIISTEAIPQETMQRWLSEAIPHLPISNLIEGKIIIGPIVLPGKTPCLNCLNLWRAELFPHHNSFELLAALDCGEGKGLELPSAQVALLTGLLATLVIQYCTSLDSSCATKLIGATLAINLFDPLNSISSADEALGYRYWQPHISCGCQRLI